MPWIRLKRPPVCCHHVCGLRSTHHKTVVSRTCETLVALIHDDGKTVLYACGMPHMHTYTYIYIMRFWAVRILGDISVTISSARVFFRGNSQLAQSNCVHSKLCSSTFRLCPFGAIHFDVRRQSNWIMHKLFRANAEGLYARPESGMHLCISFTAELLGVGPCQHRTIISSWNAW